MLICAMTLLATSLCHAENPQLVLSKSVSHYIGGRIESEEITNQFDCRDKIYATLQMDRVVKGDKNITFEWYKPDKQLELVQRDHLTASDAMGRRWASKWLSLSRGGMAGIFGDYSAYNKYTGQWVVVAKLGGVKSASQGFSLLC